MLPAALLAAVGTLFVIAPAAQAETSSVSARESGQGSSYGVPSQDAAEGGDHGPWDHGPWD